MKYVVIGFALLVAGIVYLISGYECVAGHNETQYQPPPTINVSMGEGQGSIGVPVGNIKPVEVWVCDQYERR